MDARRILERLEHAGLTLAVAESFTGGLLQDLLTDVPGSSTAFLGGVIAYHDEVKRRVLRVPAPILKRHGAVSEDVAIAMAKGVRSVLRADVGVSTTGIAGPTGATATKPVGLSIVAVSMGRRTWTDGATWRGKRVRIKERGAQQALALLDRALSEAGPG